jgi:hypothetical protein
VISKFWSMVNESITSRLGSEGMYSARTTATAFREQHLYEANKRESNRKEEERRCRPTTTRSLHETYSLLVTIFFFFISIFLLMYMRNMQVLLSPPKQVAPGSTKT